MKSLALSLLGLLFLSVIVWPSGCFGQQCQCCGGMSGCTKVCRLVCEEKKIDVVCWGCQSEEFCVPGPACLKCQDCEIVCADCSTDTKQNPVSSKPRKFVWSEWIPGSASLFTKKKLMKQTITKKVPSYKWVIEDLCSTCQTQPPLLKISQNTQLPPVPPAYAHLRLVGWYRSPED
ncbi:MAG TPA: hypothetical protein DCF63_03705 [Planctomycetaceae bacterium]|nr:hypothetical protein [Planctomycetaceae bacterium]